MPESLSQPTPPITSIFQLTDQEIFVITSSDGGRPVGQVATWVMPASLIPEHLRLVVTLSQQNRRS
jgi:flavin reductase (DIM6/NTAB) family NADH-FMN oxidoreductase RutF